MPLLAVERVDVSKQNVILLANLLQSPKPTFLHRIFHALYVGRNYIRGKIFTSSGFANSIRSFFLLEWPASSTLPQVTQKPNAKNNVRGPCALQVFGYMERTVC